MRTMDGLDGLRLLLVEDEFVLALGLADALADLGAVVVGPVATVDDALALVERVPEIDGAVLDVNLGSEVAYPVADALLARGTPFLFATANDRARLPERFAHVAVCRKPFRVDTFRDAVAALRAAPPPRQVA
jgi:CheY-like chemotaxis protein